ncbi:unnamed protein product [Protopolystoma xenopodis]|uniref:Dual specificity protein phosphatase n=1 Tax=Protopolystoma xenopodis TaxID=117903 RepID=A0A448WM72_9PLAT|nr:unnamed protein product [Protopolystoma xenopodis]
MPAKPEKLVFSTTSYSLSLRSVLSACWLCRRRRQTETGLISRPDLIISGQAPDKRKVPAINSIDFSCPSRALSSNSSGTCRPAKSRLLRSSSCPCLAEAQLHKSSSQTLPSVSVSPTSRFPDSPNELISRHPINDYLHAKLSFTDQTAPLATPESIQRVLARLVFDWSTPIEPVPMTASYSKDVLRAETSWIFPFLLLGNMYDATNERVLRELGVTHVLNATTRAPFADESRYVCYRVPASDIHSQDLKQYFTTNFAFIGWLYRL